ncbi:MAG: hypothetical protein K9N09_11960 [Candidatus Cloacimonetes bacterium]|nr:hypothetical protein [Candidatus Cloacimonadota bacterium]
MKGMGVSLFRFLSDQYQHGLKQYAEIETERFEDVLRNYKEIFWSEFNHLENISDCCELNPKIDDFSQSSKQNMWNWLDCLQDRILQSSSQLQVFFDDLINIYETYINGNTFLASNLTNSLLSTNNLFDSVSNFEEYYPVTFRGRFKKKYKGCNLCKRLKSYIENNLLKTNQSVDYFYHVPFNELYKINNYRFSITGIES